MSPVKTISHITYTVLVGRNTAQSNQLADEVRPRTYLGEQLMRDCLCVDVLPARWQLVWRCWHM